MSVISRPQYCHPKLSGGRAVILSNFGAAKAMRKIREEAETRYPRYFINQQARRRMPPGLLRQVMRFLPAPPPASPARVSQCGIHSALGIVNDIVRDFVSVLCGF